MTLILIHYSYLFILHYCFKNLLFSILSFFYSYYICDILFVSVLHFLDTLFHFFIVFGFLFFNFWSFCCKNVCQIQRFFFPQLCLLLISPLNAYFISIFCLFSFDCFFEFWSFCLYCLSVFACCLLFFFSFLIKIMVIVFSYRSDNSNIPATSELGSDACSLFSNCVCGLLVCL